MQGEKKKVVILGSTGSSGKAAVEIILQPPEDFEVTGLAAGSSVGELGKQLREFSGARFALRDGDALRRVKLDIDKLKAYTRETEAKWPHMFCREPMDPGNHLKCRMITTFTEDPATGSANGCLAGYLIKHRYFDADSIDIKVEQGAEVGRPSLIYLRASEKGDEIEVNVGGRCAMVAQGSLV